MCPRAVSILFFLTLGAGFSGCIFESSSPSLETRIRDYEAPDSPGHLLNNLSLSLEKQDLDRYLEVLAPEYHFVFFPEPGDLCGSGTWGASQDSLSTALLFLDPAVLNIQADIHHGPAAPASEVDMEGTWRILASNVSFNFRMRDATYTTEGDPHEFFFRPGRAGDGEDPDRWFLVEWRDLSGRAGAPATAPEPAAVNGIHWWQMKCSHSGIR